MTGNSTRRFSTTLRSWCVDAIHRGAEFLLFGLRTTIFLLLAFGFSQLAHGQDGPEQMTRVRAAIESFILNELGLQKKDVLIEIPDTAGEIEKDLDYDHIRILPSRGRIRKGVQLIDCGFFLQSRLVESTLIKTNVRTFQNIVVSAGDLKRHHVLKNADLALSRRETTHLTRDFYVTIDDIIGLRTTRMMGEGEILHEDVLEPRPFIKKGSEVEIRFSKGGLNIVLPGVTRRDGHLGKPVPVKCLENKRTYKAKIIDSHTVLVDLL